MLSLSLLLTLASSFTQNDAPMMPQEQHRLIIQNRILAKVHNNTISVLDVVKKMEIFFNKYYPQYADSVQAKHQYFSSQWKDTLLQMIDHELILADAEKMELKVTDSEVRETMSEKFGPNVMATLDTLGINYEEAKTMIHSELAVQRMTWFKVHSKALNSVNTQDIKLAYSNFCKKNPPKEFWEYQVLSIKAASEELADQIIQKVNSLSQGSATDIKKIAEELKSSLPNNPEEAPSFTITLSDPVKTEEKNLSTSYKEVLSPLLLNAISAPIKQISKTDKSTVCRVFQLIDHTKTTVPTLRSMHEKLQNQLIQEESDKESRIYIAKLRERYGFDAKSLEETIPTGFQPFSLQ